MFFNSKIFDVAAITAAIGVIISTFIYRKFQYFQRLNIPYEKPTFPFGNIENPAARQLSVGLQLRQLYLKLKLKGYQHAGIFLGLIPAYVPIKLEYIKNILTKDFNYFVDRGVYHNETTDPLSAHLFALNGEKWRQLRTKLTPTFTSGKLKHMFSVLTDCGDMLTDYISNKIKENDEPLDIKEILGCFTTDVIGRSAFGLECNSFKDQNSPFRQYSKKIFEHTKLQSLKEAFFVNFPTVSTILGIRRYPKDVTDFFYDVIDKAVTYREKNNIVRKDFLQLLIDLKNQKKDDLNYNGEITRLTMNEIAAQSFLFFTAGFETSSTTINFALYELARNEVIQDKVRSEINDILSNYDGQITYDALSEMKYLQQVLDETLRMYPPAPVLTRICIKDYKVPDEDVIIESGTRVIIPIFGIHYDEEYYPNPLEFDPERFSDTNKKCRPPYTYLPFGEGPRICIGMRFGLLQSKVGLAYLLKNFTFTVNQKTEVPLKFSSRSFILSADKGIWLNANKII